MSQAKEKTLNTKRTKKCPAAKKTSSKSVATDELSNELSGCTISDEKEAELFSSCESLVRDKLESIFLNLDCQSSSSKVGDEVRKKVHEDKCVSEESLQNIKLFFADVTNCKEDDDVTANRYCVIASKYLRIFIDILEVTAANELDFVMQACDLVITVHQYFFMKGKLEDCFEKVIPMLHHIIKHLYKKQSIPNIVTIIKNITNLLHIASKKKKELFTDDSKKSFTLIHQMCYSLYFKELQVLIKNQHKQTNITSNVDLRINSFIILSFSNWNENKFMEHLTNFISNESVVLMKSCVYDKHILSDSFQNLIKNLYRLTDIELQNEKTALVKSLLVFTWKLCHLYTNFCIFNRLQTELDTFLESTPLNLKTKLKCLNEDSNILKETASVCELLNQNKCSCKNENTKLQSYTVLVQKYYTNLTSKTPDVSRLFDILNTFKLQLKDGTQLCGRYINFLLDVVVFLIGELKKVSQAEQLKRFPVLLLFIRGLMLQIQIHLFPDSKNVLQCYKYEELRSVFINTLNSLLASLQALLTSLQTHIKYEDVKWLAVIYKIGGYFYNQRWYEGAVLCLKFSKFLSNWSCQKNNTSDAIAKEVQINWKSQL